MMLRVYGEKRSKTYVSIWTVFKRAVQQREVLSHGGTIVTTLHGQNLLSAPTIMELCS